MGACEVSGSFKDIDWKIGIEKIQRRDEDYYGHQDGYSGATNCVSFGFGGNHPELKTNKQISAYIRKRMENLNVTPASGEEK